MILPLKTVLITGVASALWTGSSHAAVVIDFSETGSDLVVTLSGTLDLSGVPRSPSSFVSNSRMVGNSADQIDFGGSATVPVDIASSSGIPRLPVFPILPSLITADSATGDPFIFFSHDNSSYRIFVAQTFVNGSALSASMTFNDTTLADIGGVNEDIFNLPNDTIAFTVGAGIPEPSTVGLAILGLMGLAVTRRRSP